MEDREKAPWEVGDVLRIRRRRSHGQLMKDELSESFDHLMQAATHAATGVGATVGPRVEAARKVVAPAAGRIRQRAGLGWESAVATLAPLAVAAAEGARQASGGAARAKSRTPGMAKKRRKRMRKRWPMVAGLLVVGAAAGTAGMMIRKRRMAREWHEFDPSRDLEPMPAEPTALAEPSADRTAGEGALTAPAESTATAAGGMGGTGASSGTAEAAMSGQSAASPTTTRTEGAPAGAETGTGGRNGH